MNVDRLLKSREVEEIFEWDKWMEEVPYLKFPSDWEIKVVPPFAGAIVRFRVKKGNADISVYLDCYDILGCMGRPYWEIYPYSSEEYTFRCSMNDTDELLEAITIAIEANQ